MANVLSRAAPYRYLQSVNDPDYPTEDWIHNPDMTPVQGIDPMYWLVVGDTVREMTTAEKDAAIATWQALRSQQLILALLAYGAVQMPAEQLAALRDEHTKARLDVRPAAVSYLQPWVDFEDAVQADYRARAIAIQAATTHAEVMAVSLDFSNHTPPAKVSVSAAKAMTI